MPQPAESSAGTVSRRAALKALGRTAGAVVLLPCLSDEGVMAFVRIQETNAAPSLKVLSAPQYATLEAFTEAIIPADDRSPGAKQARVADFIDLLLHESPRETALQWIGGLAALDAEAAARFRAPFVRLNPSQVDAILGDISRNEARPQTPLETFFVMTKQAAITGYYTSKIGIHDELKYQGNQFLAAFVGCETENGRDCPHCGQKHV